MKYLVRSGGLTGFAELVEAYGHSPLELMQRACITASALHSPDLYLPYPAFARLMTLAAQQCRAVDFGAQLGSRQGLEVVGALGTQLCLQACVGDALDLINRYVSFHAQGVSVDVEIGAHAVTLRLRLAFSDQVDCTQLMALSVALLVRCVGQLHGTSLRPLQVELALSAPNRSAAWRDAFDCMPSFDADCSRVLYPAELIALPVRITDDLRERMNVQWRSRNRDGAGGPSLAQQVERAIIALVPSGDCDLEAIAGLVGLQPRTLQLRLQAESLTFSELLRRARLRLACEHLARSDIDVTSLAMNLGFGSLAVFSRAFRIWTGSPPTVWRRKHATAGETMETFPIWP